MKKTSKTVTKKVTTKMEVSAKKTTVVPKKNVKPSENKIIKYVDTGTKLNKNTTSTKKIKVPSNIVKQQQLAEIKKMTNEERLANINKAYETPTHDPLSSVIADMQKKTNEQIMLKSVGLPVEKKEFAIKQTLWNRIKAFFSIKK